MYFFFYSFGAFSVLQNFMRMSKDSAKSVTENALIFPELSP